jgi:hypothetical protein
MMVRVLGTQHPLAHALRMVMSVYLAVWLAGCAGAPPRPEGDQLTTLQVRTYPATFKTVFDAAVDAAQDLDFSVDVVNADAGVITATRQTNARLARITRADDEGLPTWAWVALIATGVIIIAAVVIVLTSDDDEKDKDEDKGNAASKEKQGGLNEDGTKDEGKASRRGATLVQHDQPTHKDTVRVKYKEKARPESEHRHREGSSGGNMLYYRYEEPEADFIVIGDDSPRATEWHQYRITLHFDNPGATETKLRLSVQGARLEGSEVQEAGPVYDPQFYDKFFAYLERSLKMQVPDSTAR